MENQIKDIRIKKFEKWVESEPEVLNRIQSQEQILLWLPKKCDYLNKKIVNITAEVRKNGKKYGIETIVCRVKIDKWKSLIINDKEYNIFALKQMYSQFYGERSI